MRKRMFPVLKWAGGKTQLLDTIIERMPKTYHRYYEPFIGGGAVFLAVSPAIAVINDTNEQLINLYQQMKTNAPAIVEIVIIAFGNDIMKKLQTARLMLNVLP